MDIANLFKLFSANQRELLICFLVLLPCYFTLLLFYAPPFLTFDFHYQAIIAAAATILMMMASYTTISLSNLITKSNVYNTIATLIVNLGMLLYLFWNIDKHLTKEYFSSVVIIANASVALLFTAIFLVNRFVVKCDDKGC